MDLNHSFTVPASVEETWRTFEDIESVAGCFPGAVVTGVSGDDFTGTCKVKLGPIAMVYSGTGTFVEKDEAARRFVIDAKGKDKRGNGTAGALVTATLSEESPSSTKVDVVTDLAITGRPAQFGRGVIEDISNKLLQQFVTCLQDKVGAPSELTLEDGPTGAAKGAAGAEAVGVAGVASSSPDEPPKAGDPAAVAPPGRPVPTSVAGSAPRSAPTPGPAKDGRGSDDALDLGAAALPVLARAYGPYAGIGLLVLVVLWLLGRRR